MLDAFLREIEGDLDELRTKGRMSRADALASATGQHFNAATLPLYFTGNVAAQLVLVHLNPKQADDQSERYTGSVPTLDEYVEHNAHFGRLTYGPGSPRAHKSPFDRKQLRFLREFGVMDFEPETSPDAVYLNLERSIDHKLQMEVVPYGSNNFNVSAKMSRPLAPHFERLLDHRGIKLRAGIAATYAQMGIPMAAYARQCVDRY